MRVYITPCSEAPLQIPFLTFIPPHIFSKIHRKSNWNSKTLISFFIAVLLWCALLSGGLFCCAVLCCAVFCCAVLCCAVLCYALLCCFVLCCLVLWCVLLSCGLFCGAVLCCVLLCCAVLCCAVLCFQWPLFRGPSSSGLAICRL